MAGSRGRRDSEGWRRPVARDARWFSTAQIFINPSVSLLCVLCASVVRFSCRHRTSFVSPRVGEGLRAFGAASPRVGEPLRAFSAASPSVGEGLRAPSASPSPTLDPP